MEEVNKEKPTEEDIKFLLFYRAISYDCLFKIDQILREQEGQQYTELKELTNIMGDFRCYYNGIVDNDTKTLKRIIKETNCKEVRPYLVNYLNSH